MMRRNNRLALFARPGYPQLVFNASAETGDAEPDNWFHSENGTEWANQGYTGNRSLRINVASATADWRSSLYLVTGGKAYRVGVWLKGAAAGECFLTVRWFANQDGSGFISENNILLNGIYVTWQRVLATLLSPVNAHSGDVVWRCPSPSTADIYGDDFLVRQVN